MPRPEWKELLNRRVPQVAGVYLATGWGLLEFSSWAADRALVPEGVVDALLVSWIVLFLPALYLAWRIARPAGAPVRVPGGEASASVAVLPFENHSASPSDAYLGDGITDEITTALARVEGLRVASRTSTVAAVRRGGDVRDLGTTLDVASLLEGEVQRSGDRLRVSTRLVDAAGGHQLWSDRYDATMADVFAIQDEISESVVRALRVMLRGGEGGLRPAPRTDVRAYENYLRGRQFLLQIRRKSMRYARDMFRRAIEIDPDYAPAHAALAEAIALEQTYYPDAEADHREADLASRRALALAPELAEAHAARAAVLFTGGRLDEAEAAFHRAIERDPRLYEARYFYGRMLFQLGRYEESAREYVAAMAARPSHDAAFFAGQAYEALGRDDEANRWYRTAVDRVVDHMELNPDDARAATIRAVALCRTGRREQGLEWGRRAVEIDPDDAGVRYNLACLYAVAGEVDRSLDTLEAAVRVGFGNREWLERDPDLDAVRRDPRFLALLGSS